MYVVNDLGFLQADWGWIAGAGAAAFSIADSLLIRYVLDRAIRQKWAGYCE